VTAPASYASGLSEITVTPPDPSLPVAWWTRHFPGGSDQVAEVQRWLEDLLPDCAVRADLVAVTRELCLNAIRHSRSGEAGGQFSVDVDWAPALVRVVIGDQGSSDAPAIAPRSSDAAGPDESPHGLRFVDDVADDWGTAGIPNRQWVWADIAWYARGGPLITPPDGLDAAITSNTTIRKTFPGASIWWGHQTKAWWGAVPGSTNAHGLIRESTLDSLIQSLTRAYPHARRCG
jgi:serine/threonine-protein kinase RsbW